jgi:hypothetical protein
VFQIRGVVEGSFDYLETPARPLFSSAGKIHLPNKMVLLEGFSLSPAVMPDEDIPDFVSGIFRSDSHVVNQPWLRE